MNFDNDSVLHHADGPPTVPSNMYDFIFHGDSKLGDWYWVEVEVDGQTHEALHILVPDLRGARQGTLAEKGLELIEVFPHHAEDNWAKPGDVDGWDGDAAAPTLRPSIYVGGGSDSPGWHGFFEQGKLRDA